MRFLALFIAAFLSSAVAGAARADIVTSVWNGTLGSGHDSLGDNLAGLSFQMTFTFNSNVVSAATNYDNSSYYQEFDAGNDPGFFSSASVTLGNGVSFAMTTPISVASLYLGDPSMYYKDMYYDYTYDDNNSHLVAYFYDFVGGITNLDPAQTFSHVMLPNDGRVAELGFTTGGVTYLAYAGTGWGGTVTSVTVSDGDGVPAPASLALLSLGLLGFGQLRRQPKVA